MKDFKQKMVDFDIVGKNGLFSRVEVDHCRIAGNIQSEIIKP